ncbi:MAG: DUF2236 domain-containing protein, partial [Saprospiraceae bacterium]|nr:DUF2236 domain-containing protein [Saprospiraceae bacterium]
MSTSSIDQKFPDSLLDEMRTQQDPFADKAAAALFESMDSGGGRESAHKFIRSFVRKDFAERLEDDESYQSYPQELKDYFRNYDEFNFTEEEFHLIDEGSRLYDAHGPACTLALAVRSLLKQYAHHQAVQVLRVTTLLQDHVNRRIMETMQFVMDVMEPGWCEDHSSGRRLNQKHIGIQAIKKLRLVHAMVRYRIANGMYDTAEQGPWDDSWGKPINQEDMIFAVHTFSTEVLQGLEETGEKLTKEEKENYYQCWALIGRALGVDQRLQPSNYEEGVALQDKIYARHFVKTDDPTGPNLAKALTDWLEALLKP